MAPSCARQLVGADRRGQARCVLWKPAALFCGQTHGVKSPPCLLLGPQPRPSKSLMEHRFKFQRGIS